MKFFGIFVGGESSEEQSDVGEFDCPPNRHLASVRGLSTLGASFRSHFCSIFLFFRKHKKIRLYVNSNFQIANNKSIVVFMGQYIEFNSPVP